LWKGVNCKFSVLVVDRDTPYTSILMVVDRVAPCTSILLMVERGIPCKSILLVVDRDAPCTFILLIVERRKLQVLTTGGRQGNTLHGYCWRYTVLAL
jgi:hypothetical protein